MASTLTVDQQLRSLLARLHEVSPWRPGFRKKELLRLLDASAQELSQLSLELDKGSVSGVEQDSLKKLFFLEGFKPLLSEEQKAIELLLFQLLEDAHGEPLGSPQIRAELSEDSLLVDQVWQKAIDSGELVELNHWLVYRRTFFDELKLKMQSIEKEQGYFSVQDVKVWMKASRKYVNPVLSYIDEAWGLDIAEFGERRFPSERTQP